MAAGHRRRKATTRRMAAIRHVSPTDVLKYTETNITLMLEILASKREANRFWFDARPRRLCERRACVRTCFGLSGRPSDTDRTGIDEFFRCGFSFCAISSLKVGKQVKNQPRK